MEYEELIVRQGGNIYITVEAGDENSIRLNFRIQALNLLIKERGVEGIIETVVTTRSLGVVYNPGVTTRDTLIKRISELDAEGRELKKLPSRQIEIPLWFNDPWSVEISRIFWDGWDHDYDGGCKDNLEFLAKFNKMTVEQFIDNFVHVELWVSWVGFTPGDYVSTFLDPARMVTAPKYRVPRTWTPDRIVCIGGQNVGIHTTVSPGGYYVVGRTPWNVYEPQQKNRIFKEKPIFIKPSDRIRYYAVDGEEYHKIREEVEEGRHAYEGHIREGVFDLEEYMEMVKLAQGRKDVKFL